MTASPRARALAGTSIPVVGQGTWMMESDRAASVAALRHGIDAGLTHIDTAEMYGSGRVEEIVGEAIAGRRDELFLVSKVLPQNASRAGTIAACERSLARLGTDRLDVYLLHWRGAHPLADTFAAFERLRDDGKIRAFGVSNFDVDDMEEAVGLVGAGAIACNQVLYHLKERAIEHRLIPWHARHRIPVVGYSPFGQGDFPSARSGGGKLLAKIAKRHGVSPQAVALRFLVRDEGLFTIPKASRIGHVDANAAALDLALDDAELAAIDAAFPRGSSDALPML